MAVATGVGARDRAFQEFHKLAGMKPFAPEFLDSLIATMRSSECLTERIYAWSRWRAWANSSLFAASGWFEHRQPLDQIDCIVDLTWFKEGKSVDWVTGAPESVRIPAREAAQQLKGQYSRAFAQLRFEGRLEFRDRKIYPVVSPASPKSNGPDAEFSNWREDLEFLKYWAVAEFSNFQAREDAKRQLAEAQKLLRAQDRVAEAAYREYLKQATPEPPILISVKVVSNTATTDGPEQQPSQQEPAAAVPLPPTPEEITRVQEVTSRYGSCDPDTAERIIVNSRKEYPDASAAEVVQMISEKARSIKRDTESPIGLLVKIVPRGFRGYRRPDPDPPPSPPIEPACKLCGDSGWVGQTGAELRPCDCDYGRRIADNSVP